MATLSGDVIRCAARQLVNGTDELVNVFHFQVTAAGAGGDAGILAEVAKFLSVAYDQMDGSIANNVNPNVIDVYNMSQDYPLGSTAWTADYAGGTNSTSMNANGLALLILWRTATKRVQGKTYIGGTTVGSLDEGFFAGSILLNAADFIAEMEDDSPRVDDVSLRHIVYSADAHTIHAITNTRVVANPAYQRRRRLGRGS